MSSSDEVIFPSLLIPLQWNNHILATLEIPMLPYWGHANEEPNTIEIFHVSDNESIASILIHSFPAVSPKIIEQGYSKEIQERYLMNDNPELANWDEHKIILHRWSHLTTVPPSKGYAFVKRHSFCKTPDNELRLIILSGVAKIDGVAPQPEKALKSIINQVSAIQFLSSEELYSFS